MDRTRKLTLNDLVPLWERKFSNPVDETPLESLVGRDIDLLKSSSGEGFIGDGSPLAQDVFRARLLSQRRLPG